MTFFFFVFWKKENCYKRKEGTHCAQKTCIYLYNMYIKFRPADINWQSVIATAVIVFIPVLNGTKLNLGFLPKKKKEKKKMQLHLINDPITQDIQRWDSGGKKEWKQKKVWKFTRIQMREGNKKKKKHANGESLSFWWERTWLSAHTDDIDRKKKYRIMIIKSSKKETFLFRAAWWRTRRKGKHEVCRRSNTSSEKTALYTQCAGVIYRRRQIILFKKRKKKRRKLPRVGHLMSKVSLP